MSRGAKSCDWELKIAKNDASRKCSQVADGALFVEVLLKKVPKPVYSLREFHNLMTDQKVKPDQPIYRTLMADYAAKQKRVETLNENKLGCGNQKPKSSQSDKAPPPSTADVKTVESEPASKKPKTRAGIIKQRQIVQDTEKANVKDKIEEKTKCKKKMEEVSATVSATKGQGTETESKSRRKTCGKTAVKSTPVKKLDVKAEKSVVGPVVKKDSKPVITKGKRKESSQLSATPASTPHVPSTAERIAKRAKTAAALRGKKGGNASRKDSAVSRPSRTSCFPTVDELLQYAQESRMADTNAIDEYRQSSNAYYEQLLESYSKEYFPTWLEHLQLDRNLLLYGPGCKQRLLKRFAKDMLQDEDVLELTAPRTAPDSSEESKRSGTKDSKNSASLGQGDQSSASTSITRENIIWVLLETIKRHIVGIRKENATSDYGAHLTSRGGQPGLSNDGRTRRSTSSVISSNSGSKDTGLSLSADDGGISSVAYKREMQEQWYCHQDCASVVIEEATLLCEMLLSHYNWRSVAERGNNQKSADVAILGGRGQSPRESAGGCNILGFNSDIDGIEDDEADERCMEIDDTQVTGEQSRNPRGRRKTAGLGVSDFGGITNMAYDNSICRLYILLHNMEDIFPLVQESSFASCPHSEHQIALSIIAQCPVVSLVASCSSVASPINMQWDQDIYSSFQWTTCHTPTYMHYALLPDIIHKCEAAALAGKAGKGRSIMALRYILRSLTRKHCDVLKHVIKMQERAAAQSGKLRTDGKGDNDDTTGSSSEPAPVGDSLFGPLPVKSSVPNQKDKSNTSTRSNEGSTAQIGIKWNELLAVCTTQMITKSDVEMRKLISELVDQRIIKAYGDGQSMMVSLLLSTDEVDGALRYFDGKK